LLLGPTLLTEGSAHIAVSSCEDFFPRVSFDSNAERGFTKADFVLATNTIVSVDITNITGMDRKNPSSYCQLELEDVRGRFVKNDLEISGIDHVGFNLPWFNGGIHPAIGDLRNRLKLSCLYHTFPTGEPWDFIIPGKLAETRRQKAIDYEQIRKPKFEIVSFDKASTPLVQIDVASKKKYEELSSLFPEALDDQNMKNIWIYLRNPSDIDICLVINESTEGDWSSFFKGHRIV
jgi:hypothetical protein